MHASSYRLMTEELKKITLAQANVLDVGSLDVNGTYKPLLTRTGWKYTGLDIKPGKNVDIVAPPFKYPFPTNHFDLVISGSTMEHVTAIWLWVPELVRVLKPGGFLIIIVPWSGLIHRYPLDCWRIFPDGMQYLFDETHALENYHIEIPNKNDLLGSAFKKRTP